MVFSRRNRAVQIAVQRTIDDDENWSDTLGSDTFARTVETFRTNDAGGCFGMSIFDQRGQQAADESSSSSSEDETNEDTDDDGPSYFWQKDDAASVSTNDQGGCVGFFWDSSTDEEVEMVHRLRRPPMERIRVTRSARNQKPQDDQEDNARFFRYLSTSMSGMLDPSAADVPGKTKKRRGWRKRADRRQGQERQAAPSVAPVLAGNRRGLRGFLKKRRSKKIQEKRDEVSVKEKDSTEKSSDAREVEITVVQQEAPPQNETFFGSFFPAKDEESEVSVEPIVDLPEEKQINKAITVFDAAAQKEETRSRREYVPSKALQRQIRPDMSDLDTNHDWSTVSSKPFMFDDNRSRVSRRSSGRYPDYRQEDMARSFPKQYPPIRRQSMPRSSSMSKRGAVNTYPRSSKSTDRLDNHRRPTHKKSSSSRSIAYSTARSHAYSTARSQGPSRSPSTRMVSHTPSRSRSQRSRRRDDDEFTLRSDWISLGSLDA